MNEEPAQTHHAANRSQPTNSTISNLIQHPKLPPKEETKPTKADDEAIHVEKDRHEEKSKEDAANKKPSTSTIEKLVFKPKLPTREDKKEVEEDNDSTKKSSSTPTIDNLVLKPQIPTREQDVEAAKSKENDSPTKSSITSSESDSAKHDENKSAQPSQLLALIKNYQQQPQISKINEENEEDVDIEKKEEDDDDGNDETKSESQQESTYNRGRMEPKKQNISRSETNLRRNDVDSYRLDGDGENDDDDGSSGIQQHHSKQTKPLPNRSASLERSSSAFAGGSSANHNTGTLDSRKNIRKGKLGPNHQPPEEAAAVGIFN